MTGRSFTVPGTVLRGGRNASPELSYEPRTTLCGVFYFPQLSHAAFIPAPAIAKPNYLKEIYCEGVCNQPD
jgi:hypothetical protein